MLAFSRFELRRTLRDSRFLFFLVAMPAGLYLLYGGFTSTGTLDGLPAAYGLMVAMMCYAAIGAACYAIGPPLAQERATLWIKQLRVMPLRAPAWLATKVVQGAVLTLPGVIVVAVAATLSHQVRLDPEQWLGLAGVLLLGSLPFTALGLVIGQALDGQAANSATLFIVLGLSFAGGLLIPDAQLPEAVRNVAAVLPSHALADLARAATTATRVSPTDVAVLIAWAIASAGAALALWRRDGAAA